MSFWDNVKKFTQPYSDEDYDDYEDEEFDDFEEDLEESGSRGRRPMFGSSQESALDFAGAGTAPAVAPAAAPATGFGGAILNASSGNKQEVVLYHAKAFDDAAKAADELKNKKAVILNMENVDKALTRRVVDFLSGCGYALDGKVKKIAQCTYLFCPHNMDIVGDLENFQGEIESYI